MNSQSQYVLAKLTFLVSNDVRGQAGIAEKIGYSEPHVSEVFRRKKKVTKRFAKEIEALMKAQAKQSEPSSSIVRCAVPPYRVDGETQPIGHIPFEGRDWRMNVPVSADAERNAAVMAAAARLLNAARDDASSRIAAQVDADALAQAWLPLGTRPGRTSVVHACREPPPTAAAVPDKSHQAKLTG